MTTYTRAAAVAFMAVVLLTGCRARQVGAGSTDRPPATPSTTSTPTSTGPDRTTNAGTGGTSAQVDSDLGTIDGLLGQLDGQVSKGDQVAQDGDG
jgi:hypothetical protein